MAQPPRRLQLTDAKTLAALAHPLRLALLDHLMAFGPRTASECAQVVGASPSNCSWHLRHLASFGLVERAHSEDGRERPWQAAATGFDFPAPNAPGQSESISDAPVSDAPGAIAAASNTPAPKAPGSNETGSNETGPTAPASTAPASNAPSAEAPAAEAPSPNAPGRDASSAIEAATQALATLGLDADLRLTRAYLQAHHLAAPAWREAAVQSTYELRLTATELHALERVLDAAIRPYIGLTRADAPEDAQPVHISLRAFLRPETL